MTISTAMTTSFKVALLNGEMDFSSDTTQTFKIALYVSTATLNASTTAYTATGEVANGNGYTTGGQEIGVSVTPTSSGTTAYMSFDDVTWSSGNFTARGALIYRSSGSGNPSVAVFEFGEDKQVSGGDFTIVMPEASIGNAVIRIA